MESTTQLQADTAENFVVVVEPHFALYRYLKIIREQGYKTLVLTSDPRASLAGEQRHNRRLEGYKDSRIDQLVQYETQEVESLVRALRPFRGQIAGVVAGEDSTVPIAADLGRALGFDYALPEDARCQHAKTKMKQRFTERGVRTPRFGVARELGEAVSFWESFGRDCMVKMVDFAASLNIFRVSTREQLETAWDIIIENRRGLDVPFELAREVILEEFVGGRELTAEGYIQGDHVEILNFSEKLTEDNFIVVGHYIPAVVSDSEARIISGIATQCVRALGLRRSVFHVEVHLRDDVPYVIECASRPPGQHTVELIEKTYGIDLMKISIDLATNREVDVSRVAPHTHHAILALYTKTSGTLQGFHGIDELRSRGGVAQVSLGAKPGDTVRALDTFRDKYGLVILESATSASLRENARWLRENVGLVVSSDR